MQPVEASDSKGELHIEASRATQPRSEPTANREEPEHFHFRAFEFLFGSCECDKRGLSRNDDGSQKKEREKENVQICMPGGLNNIRGPPVCFQLR